jgi:hypothetical protein
MILSFGRIGFGRKTPVASLETAISGKQLNGDLPYLIFNCPNRRSECYA